MTCYMPHALPPPRARGRVKSTVGVCRLDPPPKIQKAIDAWKREMGHAAPSPLGWRSEP